MNVVWEQVLILFIFVIIGFSLGKFKLVGQDQAKILSTLSVYVFLPCRIFKSFSSITLCRLIFLVSPMLLECLLKPNLVLKCF